jgi:hypothetical protein
VVADGPRDAVIAALQTPRPAAPGAVALTGSPVPA